MTSSPANIPLILFAKAPVAGRVKTRLMTHCSATQAAEIAKILISATLRNARRYWPGRVILSVWPDLRHPFIRHSVADRPAELVVQPHGNLGEKMHRSMQQYGYPAAILGCDAPHVSPAALQATWEHLQSGTPVIGPSHDGGYYLIGLAGDAPAIFDDIEWGTERVLAQTMQRADTVGLKFARLPELHDIDTWDDVLAAASELPELELYLQNGMPV